MAGLAYRRDVLAHRIFQVQADDVLPGNHDFPGQTVGKIKDVADKLAFYLVDLPFLVAGRDEHADFIFRVGHVDFIGHLEIAAAENGLAQPVAQADERVKQPAPRLYQRPDSLQAPLCPLQADGFGNKLAKYPGDAAQDDADDGIGRPDNPRFAGILHKLAVSVIQGEIDRRAADEAEEGHAQLGRP